MDCNLRLPWFSVARTWLCVGPVDRVEFSVHTIERGAGATYPAGFTITEVFTDLRAVSYGVRDFM